MGVGGSDGLCPAGHLVPTRTRVLLGRADLHGAHGPRAVPRPDLRGCGCGHPSPARHGAAPAHSERGAPREASIAIRGQYRRRVRRAPAGVPPSRRRVRPHPCPRPVGQHRRDGRGAVLEPELRHHGHQLPRPLQPVHRRRRLPSHHGGDPPRVRPPGGHGRARRRPHLAGHPQHRAAPAARLSGRPAERREALLHLDAGRGPGHRRDRHERDDEHALDLRPRPPPRRRVCRRLAVPGRLRGGVHAECAQLRRRPPLPAAEGHCVLGEPHQLLLPRRLRRLLRGPGRPDGPQERERRADARDLRPLRDRPPRAIG